MFFGVIKYVLNGNGWMAEKDSRFDCHMTAAWEYLSKRQLSLTVPLKYHQKGKSWVILTFPPKCANIFIFIKKTNMRTV